MFEICWQISNTGELKCAQVIYSGVKDCVNASTKEDNSHDQHPQLSAALLNKHKYQQSVADLWAVKT